MRVCNKYNSELGNCQTVIFIGDVPIYGTLGNVPIYVKIVKKRVMFKVVSIENFLSRFLFICKSSIRNIQAERSLFFSPFYLLFNPKSSGEEVT